MLVQVDDEVLLGLELVGKLLRVHQTERALLGFGGLVTLHEEIRRIF